MFVYVKILTFTTINFGKYKKISSKTFKHFDINYGGLFEYISKANACFKIKYLMFFIISYQNHCKKFLLKAIPEAF